MKAFDLSTLGTSVKSEKGSVLELRHPISGEVLRAENEDGSTRPVTITMLGTESEVSKKFQRDAQRRRLRKGFQYKTTPEEIEAAAMDLLVALTVGWDGVGLGGEESLEFTPENVKRVYGEISWIKKQVDEFIGDIGNFLGN